MERSPGRHVVGANVIDLVKFVKNHERATAAVLPLSGPARALVERRVLMAEWVPLAIFLELMRTLDTVAIKGSEQRAMELGASGGAVMRGLQKAFVVPGDPASSAAAMRHVWRAHYDFGRLRCHITNAHSVRFTIDEYDDMPMVHGLTTVGWGVSAARAAGASDTRVEILQRPWRREPCLMYDLTF